MEHLTLSPDICEFFKECMLSNQWELIHQDAGQTHLVGWGYEMTWKKKDLLVILRYSEKQGIANAFLEISREALLDIQSLVERAYLVQK